MKKVKILYVGKGEYYPGVPAKDHEVDEEQAEALVKSGLYKLERQEKPAKKAAAKQGKEE